MSLSTFSQAILFNIVVLRVFYIVCYEKPQVTVPLSELLPPSTFLIIHELFHCCCVGTCLIVFSVFQIIMAKQAGGPKPKENKDWDED
jgi:hypothetical protein